MRKIVVAAVLLLSAPSLAMAQLAATTSPPTASASSQAPQSANSLPTGGATAIGGRPTGAMTTQVGPSTPARPRRIRSARVRRALRPSPDTQAATLPTPANH